MAERPTPEEVVRKVAKYAQVIGLLGILLIGAMTVGHFYFGAPITNGNTGRPMTDAEILLTDGFMMGGFALVTLLGAWVLRNPEHPWLKQYIRLVTYFAPPWGR